jgi:integrase/recombinase XerD
MNKAVNITKRIKVQGKGYRFCAAVWADKKRLKPNWVVVDGKTELHTDGCYYVSYYSGKTLKREPCESHMKAIERKNELEDLMAVQNRGYDVMESSAEAARNLKKAAEEWLEEIKLNKSAETARSYRNSIELFLESCKKVNLEDIERKDLLQFKYDMTKKGLEASTQKNRFVIVRIFLTAHDIDARLKRGDAPKAVTKLVEVYEEKELLKFFASCNDYERTLFNFFLTTGFRHQEVKFLTWDCVNLSEGEVSVKAHPEFKWTPKTHEERTVPIPEYMVKLLSAWEERSGACNLVFPSSICRPNTQLLIHCKAVAIRAGLKKPDRAKKDYFLHKFRATFGTTTLRNTDFETARYRLGHKDMKSTMRYVTPNRGAQVKREVEQTWKAFS